MCFNHAVLAFYYLASTFVLYLQMSSLLVPLIQLVKTGFTKAAQRLDGIYALLLMAKIVSLDVKAGISCW